MLNDILISELGRDDNRGFGCGCDENPPAAKPAGQEKPARDKPAGGFLHPHPHPPGFVRVSGARGFGKIYYKNRQILNLNRQEADFS